MAIKLPPPPRQNASTVQWEQYRELVWRYLVGVVKATGNTAAEISSATTYHGVTALTAPRILTLPRADDLSDGDEIVVQDESGAAGTHNITLQCQGSDTVNGGASVAISTNFGRRRIIKRGVGKYFSA